MARSLAAVLVVTTATQAHAFRLTCSQSRRAEFRLWFRSRHHAPSLDAVVADEL